MHRFSYNKPVIQLVQSIMLLQVEQGAIQTEHIPLIESPKNEELTNEQLSTQVEDAANR